VKPKQHLNNLQDETKANFQTSQMNNESLQTNKILYEKSSNIFGLGMAHIVFSIENKKYIASLYLI